MLMKNTRYMGIILGITLFITSMVCCKKELLPEAQVNKLGVTVIDTTTKTLVVTPRDTSKTIPGDTTNTVVTTPSQTVTVDYLKSLSGKAGSNDFFTIKTNTSWKITSFPNWTIVSPLSGTGDAKVTVTVQENTGAQRTGAITITGTGVSKNSSVNVIQLTAASVPTLPGQAAVAKYYVAPNGSDNNSGTIDKPFGTLNKLWKVIQAGDLVYLRGGTYAFTSQQVLSGKSGSSGNTIKVWAYPGETPIITKGTGYSASFGVYFNNNNYVHIKGWDISGYTQSTAGNITFGIKVQNSNNCTFELINYHNNGCGFNMNRGSTNNLVINSDFHHNYDPYTPIEPYGNADGLGMNTDLGTVNTFDGCRAWSNSDDGFDAYRSDGNLIIKNCWAWNNGYKEDGITTGGNGTGFKIGITLLKLPNEVLRTITNNLAFKNRDGGIYMAGANCISHVYNNTTWSNRGAPYTTGFGFGDIEGIANVIKNNIAFDEMLVYSGVSSNIHDHNTWDTFSVTANDFVSLNYTGVDGPRQADGSLPNLDFLKLKKTSKLYQKGVNVGLPFNGSAPNVGAN